MAAPHVATDAGNRSDFMRRSFASWMFTLTATSYQSDYRQ
jgi:hypothetical protein